MGVMAGSPALTANTYGKGKAYYIASRNEAGFLRDFYGKLIAHMPLERVFNTDLPAGVTAQMRTDGDNRYILMNFNDRAERIALNADYTDLLTEKTLHNIVTLERYGVMVLRKC